MDIDYISHETIRRILQENGIKYRRTKTWKESNDPNFEIKKNKIVELYRSPPKDGRVLCLDEFGPLEIRPQLGENWALKPDLVPATYTRDKGVRHLIAFLDLTSNRLYGHIKKRKGGMSYSMS